MPLAAGSASLSTNSFRHSCIAARTDPRDIRLRMITDDNLIDCLHAIANKDLRREPRVLCGSFPVSAKPRDGGRRCDI